MNKEVSKVQKSSFINTIHCKSLYEKERSLKNASATNKDKETVAKQNVLQFLFVSKRR